MKKLGYLGLALGAAVLVVPALKAGPSPQPFQLVTAEIFVGTDDTFYCRILNLAKSSSDITVDVIDNLGATRATAGPFTVAPGQSQEAFVNGNLNVRCQFTIVGEKREYRGIGCLAPQSGGLAKSFRDCIPAE